MRVAYLIDKPSIGGGVEYIQRRIAIDRREGRESRIFYSSRRECTVAELDGWRADEIVVNHLKALLQLLCNPWRRPAGRVTFVVHGLHIRKYECLRRDGGLRGLWARLAFPLRRALEAWLYRRCNRIVVEIESDCSAVRRLYGEKLPVSVEHNTLEKWRPVLSEALPLSARGPFKYLCIGRFDYQKGQDRWIKKIKNEELRMKNEGGRTLFIGDGPTLAGCRRLARKLGVEDLCVFAGAIPDAERYLKCAEVVVSPSRWEGMPYLMMKARALGCRILATDCPGNHDVLSGYEWWEKLEI